MSTKGHKRTWRQASYSMIWSACASINVGISIPCAFAVFAFTISSSLVGCSIGNSLGFAPFRILSTKVVGALKVRKPR
jgi:hypothetical protein